MNEFEALWIEADESGRKPLPPRWNKVTVDQLSEGDVTVKVTHSTINYKDGLALAGAPGIVRKFPMVPGIDVVGEVLTSDSDRFKPGDQVILNGYGVGEVHTGAYAKVARLKSECLLHRPSELSPARAAAIGTAGYTAMLCVMALERYGITPEQGPVAVSGASGGVGSVAISILSKLGFETIAFTGRLEETDFLKSLGASEVLDRAQLSEKGKPFGKERWAAAVDVAGSHTLANLIAQTNYGGAVAACGLAQGMDLSGSVMPFILRSVALLGVDSVMAPMALREEAYARLVQDLDLAKLDSLSEVIKLADVEERAAKLLKGQVRGRTIVEVA
ncbi:Acrylyl-CoA reductase AcuI [Pseudovibrio axinellae]|uniref:Acrylyl-CoA reductase AcuI n=1 Tax=Pseudovibrio axinellae TaxID=989403 RepID=A0A165YGJ3_9HYPH|nr:MDR family oxidoreductase [Pseudovibrio axinellae]KZL18824.1 Acrylyl-CoA reductase AcuI [Pseudovibrio axinellae]SEP91493.1 acrylyl-CoA reductase (NADPH) [Pseudovibrio axinellae]